MCCSRSLGQIQYIRNRNICELYTEKNYMKTLYDRQCDALFDVVVDESNGDVRILIGSAKVAVFLLQHFFKFIL